MNISEIPLQYKKHVLELLTYLDGKHGFNLSDFLEPEPSEEPPHFRWKLRLKSNPSYYFSYKKLNGAVEINIGLFHL